MILSSKNRIKGCEWILKKEVEDYLVKLSSADRQTLQSYCTLCDCLSSFLGNAYEIVVHSLGIGDRFIQKIVKGYHSGRTENDTIDSSSAIAIEQLYARVKHGDMPVTVCFSTGEDGGMYKSATIGIIGSGKKIIGMICFNFYLNTPLTEIIESIALPRYLIAADSSFSTYSSNGYDEILYETIEKAKQAVMSDPDIPSKFKKKEIIRRLNEIGIFGIKKGVAICAEILEVTITTIYMHIRNLGVTT